jgi:adenosylcobinamide kinase / adenosylcobinamide-phosphate guanylyltransferase
MQKVALVLGGSRSGKSAFALKEASVFPGKKAFIATAEGLDQEMLFRIEKHKKERGKDWITHEEPLLISGLIRDIGDRYAVILVDCLTLWLSNIMHAGYDVQSVTKELSSIVGENRAASLYIISNEVGLGLVPESSLAREYRDNLGILNQEIAKVATDVYFMAAGIPLRLKGGGNQLRIENEE